MTAKLHLAFAMPDVYRTLKRSVTVDAVVTRSRVHPRKDSPWTVQPANKRHEVPIAFFAIDYEQQWTILPRR